MLALIQIYLRDSYRINTALQMLPSYFHSSLFSVHTSRQPSTLLPTPKQAINHDEGYAKATMQITDH